MKTLSITQRALLARQHQIVVRVERADGVVLCWDRGQERYYTSDDLQRMAQPSAVERLCGWIAGYAGYSL